MSTSNIKSVNYPNLGWDTAADLYLPPGFDAGKQYPAIVSTHPIGSCKGLADGRR
ncbi:alpha/beta hydrolase [Burkholderia lata]|uniref:alpha/beta hydrolase n=1 Tax=Burkholderia TaxID=32008 RepID=UPI001453A67B|nr:MULTISPECIES: alpha/beta hydrolase [Burkholderia]VWB13900.1 alpha/beta hydrolase [Burkholderia lata]